jgi:5-(carboxyamino)imidazole ribonucleotide mutase
MPPGVPVATVAIDGAANAAQLAVQILAVSDAGLAKKLAEHKKEMADAVLKKAAALSA